MANCVICQCISEQYPRDSLSLSGSIDDSCPTTWPSLEIAQFTETASQQCRVILSKMGGWLFEAFQGLAGLLRVIFQGQINFASPRKSPSISTISLILHSI